ncbi:MAG TPA: hypothetical protein PLP27_12065, partial [Crocinitomicaceae bacterium]|nr:hypothetical protein [Crocinitomicaceae bacterium]
METPAVNVGVPFALCFAFGRASDTSKKELAHALFTAVFMEKQKALDKIKSLVERFEEQKEFYK